MSKCKKVEDVFSLLSDFLSVSDVLSAKQLAIISNMIFEKRLQLKMNQKEFADFMGVSQAMISKWESGEYNFTIETISKICEKLSLIYEINFKEKNEIKEQITENIRECKDWSCKCIDVSILKELQNNARKIN